MRLLIFLVFIQYGLPYKFGIIFQTSIWCNNCQLGKAITELDSIYFLNKRCFGLMFYF